MLKKLGEHLSASYEIDPDDAMPFDDNNDKVPDRLQPQLEDKVLETQNWEKITRLQGG